MLSFPAILRGPSGFTYPYSVDNSCMFDSASVSYAYRTNPTSTSATTGTVSFWVKRSTITGTEQAVLSGRYNDNNQGRFSFTTVDEFQVVCKDGGSIRSFLSDAVFRDCSGWYHFVVAFDGTQATGTDRINVYCNGELLSGTYATALNMQFEGFMGSGSVASIGRRQRNAEMYFNGYLAEIVGVDGQQLDATSFGQTKNGIWVPKAYTGTYGDNGSHVKFENSADLGNDSASVLDYTLVNIGTNHQVPDSPTNNYCTLDDNNRSASLTAFKEGGLIAGYTGAAYGNSIANFPMKSGKWYWECYLNGDADYGGSGILANGELSGDITPSTFNIIGSSLAWLTSARGSSNIVTAYNGGNDFNLTGFNPATTATLMYAFDADANKLWFGMNGSWWNSASPSAGTGAHYDSTDGIDSQQYDLVPFCTQYQHAGMVLDFGQRGYTYTPPTGFNALCSANLDDPTVLRANTGFDVVLYEGTGAELAISDLNFTPDFVAIKNRDAADSWMVFDSVRGATKYTQFDTQQNEVTDAQSLKTFDTSGFTVGTNVEVNTSTEKYLALCLKKGAKYGFDIQTYTGTGSAHTESHNLGAIPDMIEVTHLTGTARADRVYHVLLNGGTTPEQKTIYISETTGIQDSTDPWNDTAPTASVFTVGDVGTNNVGVDFVAYLWKSIPGFSKVFSFTGNGNAAGPYIHCGFRPRFILCKNSNGANQWWSYDTARNTVNVCSSELRIDAAAVEGSEAAIDIFANGFKLRVTTAAFNTNNDEFIGIAFAEQPGKFSNAR